jgi:hypothetical protein
MARNILFLMADQLAPQSLPFHGHRLVKAPHLEALAAGERCSRTPIPTAPYACRRGLP